MYMTTAEYLATPESVLPQELIHGRMMVADAPLVPHQAAVADLFRALDAHVRERGIGRMWLAPLDVILDGGRAVVVQPDLLFVSEARRHIVGDRVHGAPDLVIEVLSPNPRVGRIDTRLDLYARYGVGECWLVHVPDRRIEIVGFARGTVRSRRVFVAGARLVSDVLPRFDATPGAVLEGT